MTLTELYAAVRAETAHDSDLAIDNTTHLLPWFVIEYRKLRRKLTARFPSLFLATSSTTTLSGSAQSITKPSDFERLERIERLNGSKWEPIPRSERSMPEQGAYVGFREEGATFVIAPVELAPGTYRLVYVTGPGCFPASDVPAGFEDVLIQKVIAKVHNRTGGDPAPHIAEAAATERAMMRALASRMGSQPEPGFAPHYDQG